LAPNAPHRLQTEFSDRESAARETARRITDGQLVKHALETLVKMVVDHHALEDANILLDKTHLRHNVQGNPHLEVPPLEQQTVELRFIAPCNSVARFLGEANESLVSGSDAKSWNAHKSYWIKASEYNASVLQSHRRLWEKEMSEKIQQHNRWVAEHRARMQQEVRGIVELKQQITSAIHKDAESLEIPLRPSPTAVAIPIEPKTLQLTEVEARANAGEPVYKLADNIADQLIETLHSFALALGRQHKVSARMLQEGEESLRDMLLFILNAQWQGQVTGETFVGKGKTDLLFRYKGVNAFIGECKIWTGQKAFTAAIDQLLGYIVWNDTRAGLIIFIRGKKDVESVINKARKCIQEHANYIPTGSSENEFIVHSRHDSRRHIRISLIPMHIPDEEEPPVQAVASAGTAEAG
jgi:hypothetical protein